MSDFACSRVGRCEPQLLCPIRLEKKFHYALVSAVAFAAIALIVIGLSAYFHQSGVLYAQLGIVGAYAFSIVGGAALLGVLIVLACNVSRLAHLWKSKAFMRLSMSLVKRKRDREEDNIGNNMADEQSYEDRGKIIRGIRGYF